MNCPDKCRRAGGLAVDRELALTALTLAVAGPALLAGAAWPLQPTVSPTARRTEQACWRAIWMSALPAVVTFSVLLGWATIEPQDSERLPLSVLVVSGLFAGVWLRALARAWWTLTWRGDAPVAGTIGLLRPRLVLSDVLIRRLDGDALAAVHAHEACHIRHRDPLRIWLAQFVIDLQWPWPGASRRFERWRRVLELARDEEARLAGIDGADLAAAVLTATRLGASSSRIAGLTDAGVDLRERISRLLAPLPIEEPVRASVSVALVPACALVLAALSGARFGEALVQIVTKSLP